MKTFSVMGLVALGAMATFLVNGVNAEDRYQQGDTIVVNSCCDMQIGHSTVGRVHRGSTHEVKQVQGEWLQIDNNGTTGWVSTRYVQPSAWVSGNTMQGINATINLALKAANENTYRAKRGYDAIQAANQYARNGIPGDPSKALGAVVAIDSLLKNGPLSQAGVGPQAAFITSFMDTAVKSAMEQHDSGTTALKHGLAEQQLQLFHTTGDPKYLMNAVNASRPDPTYSQLKSWNGRDPLTISSYPASPAQSSSTIADNLTSAWTTTVHKQPFSSSATNPVDRMRDWASWALNQNNSITTQSFNHTIQSPSGTTKVESLRTQTGYGYQPGETRRHEYSSVQQQGSHRHRFGGGTKPYDYYTTQPSVPTQTYSAPRYTTPSYSRPSISMPNVNIPTPSFRR